MPAPRCIVKRRGVRHNFSGRPRGGNVDLGGAWICLLVSPKPWAFTCSKAQTDPDSGPACSRRSGLVDSLPRTLILDNWGGPPRANSTLLDASNTCHHVVRMWTISELWRSSSSPSLFIVTFANASRKIEEVSGVSGVAHHGPVRHCRWSGWASKDQFLTHATAWSLCGPSPSWTDRLYL